MSSIETHARRERASAARPRLRLVTTPPARPETSSVAVDEQPINLKIGFSELVLIHRSLEAVRTLALVEGQDDLLTDTLQLIDLALEEAV